MNSMETMAGGQTAAEETDDILDTTQDEAQHDADARLQEETSTEPQAASDEVPADQAPVAEAEADEDDDIKIVVERGETGFPEERVLSSDMEDLAMEDWDYQRPRRGEIRDGVILAIRDQEIIVDVGAKRDGVVPYADMQRLGAEGIAELSPGDEVPVYIMRPEDQDGNLLVSLYMARQTQAWDVAQKMYESGEVWEAEVTGYNKGGVVIPVLEIRGFVPASQVPGFPMGVSQEDRLQRLAEVVGEKLRVKIIEINQRKRRLILSATTAEKQWRKKQREQLLEELREGEVRTGRVSSLASFGAFVDLGGADGLIHISELAWRRVRHPKEVVKVGDEVEVYVLRLDHERNRIGLSLKRLEPEPWALVEDKYELGQLVEGVVTNVVDFGAFAEIEEGIEGLIHVSELADAAVSHPRDVVKKGDLLLLRIIRIDVRRKRLGLSLKRVLESEWAEWAAQLTVNEEQGREEESAPAPEASDAAEQAVAGDAETDTDQASPTAAQEPDTPEDVVADEVETDTDQASPVAAQEPDTPEDVAADDVETDTDQSSPTAAQESDTPEDVVADDAETDADQQDPNASQEPGTPGDEEQPAPAPELATVEG